MLKSLRFDIGLAFKTISTVKTLNGKFKISHM